MLRSEFVSDASPGMLVSLYRAACRRACAPGLLQIHTNTYLCCTHFPSPTLQQTTCRPRASLPTTTHDTHFSESILNPQQTVSTNLMRLVISVSF